MRFRDLGSKVRELNTSIEWFVGELTDVIGDSSMLRIVWSTLLGNALK